MDLHLVVLPFVLAFSLASTNQCVSSPGSSIELSLHNLKNASGHWITTVDTRRFTMKENPRELTVNVHQGTRSCDSNEIEQLVSVAFVYPSLTDTATPGAPEFTGPLFTTPSTRITAAPSTTTTTTTPSTRITAAPSTTATTNTPSTRITAAPSTTARTTPPSTRITAVPSTTATTTTPSTRITTAPSTTATTNTPSTRITAAPSTTATTTTPSSATTRTITITTIPKSCPRVGYQQFPEFSCYKVFPSGGETKTWSDAREQCRKDGGDLMVMETERERKEVYVPLYNSVSWSYSHPWVGVHIPQGGDGWMTVKGEPALSTWWSPGRPDKYADRNCARALLTGLMWNWECAEQRNFICEIPL